MNSDDWSAKSSRVMTAFTPGSASAFDGVDLHDARVGMRAAQHAADELAGQVEVGAEARPSRDLVDAIRADGPRADVALPVGPVRAVLGHGYPFLSATAASFTAVTILS